MSDRSSRDGILDTNALVLLERLDPAELPDQPRITAVSLAELSIGPLVTGDPIERALRQDRLQRVEAAYEPIPFDTTCARAYGSVAASLHRAGRKSSARALDALIAATAIANGLPLFTCNGRDFAGIDGLDLRILTHPDTDEN